MADADTDTGRARACLDGLIPEAVERAAADYRRLARAPGPAPDDAAGWTRHQGALKAGVAHLEALCRLAAAARRLGGEETGGSAVPDLDGLIAGARAELNAHEGAAEATVAGEGSR